MNSRAVLYGSARCLKFHEACRPGWGCGRRLCGLFGHRPGIPAVSQGLDDQPGDDATGGPRTPAGRDVLQSRLLGHAGQYLARAQALQRLLGFPQPSGSEL